MKSAVNTLTYTFLLLFLPLFSQAQVSTSQNVVYGEVGYLRQQAPENVFRIFLDREGHLYPDVLISDEDMRANGASLFQWTKANEEDFEFILSSYSVSLQADADHAEKFEALQELLAEEWRATLDAVLPAGAVLNVLVHGFRKSVHPGRSARTSVDDVTSLREALMKETPEGKNIYLEVYWDGTFDCCFGTKLRENARLFKLFETEARRNAVAAGYGLRRVVSDLNVERLNVVTHSLGARVGMSLILDAYTNAEVPGKEWHTPQQAHVKTLLIAPAIDGKEEFSHYQDRCSVLPYLTADNYEVMVIFNRKDFVLRKKDPMLYLFGPGARGKGSTRLGCNRFGMVNKVQRKLLSLGCPDALQTIDFQSMGRCHLVRCYVRDPQFELALDFLK